MTINIGYFLFYVLYALNIFYQYKKVNDFFKPELFETHVLHSKYNKECLPALCRTCMESPLLSIFVLYATWC